MPAKSTRFYSTELPQRVAHRLNEAFYRGSPVHYFEQRLLFLLTAHEMGGEDTPLPPAESVERVLGEELVFESDGLTASARELHVATESQVLLHHLAECLLRVTLAHVGLPPCPWLELAGLSDFGVFKRRIRDEIVDVDLPTLVATLDAIFGPQIDGGEEPATVDRAATVMTMAQFLKALAARLLDDAPLYNAAKHGLALNAGRWMVELHLDTDEMDAEEKRQAESLAESFRFKGIALECMEWDQVGSSRAWFTHQRFVDTAGDLALAYAGIQVLANLWSVAAARYAGGGAVRLPSLTACSPDEIATRSGESRGSVRKSILAVPLPDDQASAVLKRLGIQDVK